MPVKVKTSKIVKQKLVSKNALLASLPVGKNRREIDTWVETNVDSLEDVRKVLKTLIKLLPSQKGLDNV